MCDASLSIHEGLSQLLHVVDPDLTLPRIFRLILAVLAIFLCCEKVAHLNKLPNKESLQGSILFLY